MEGKRSQKNLESSTSSDEGSLRSKEVNNGKDPNRVGACLYMITKRKQQREAVEAILNASLISSKKTEPSTKSMASKRPLQTSVVSGGSDLPRQEKVCGSRKKVYCKIRSISTTVKVKICVIPVWYEVRFYF